MNGTGTSPVHDLTSMAFTICILPLCTGDELPRQTAARIETYVDISSHHGLMIIAWNTNLATSGAEYCTVELTVQSSDVTSRSTRTLEITVPTYEKQCTAGIPMLVVEG